MEISIATPREFNFKRTVISHGWYELLPFKLNREKWVLLRTLDLQEGKPVTVTITATKRALRINPSRRLSQAAANKVVSDVRHMLRLDDDMGEFYRLLADDRDFSWIPTQGAGRMLRSPTVFEDLVKMICTTNCSWALTEKMVTGLVENLGRESNDGLRTFPTPEAMALMPVKFYVNEVRAGYRAAYLKELADRVAAGNLDVEAWLKSPLPTADLIKAMRGVMGVGPYAAENLLKLLGRYDGLALDSWTRARFFSIRNNGRKTTDKRIARYYSRFKEWRGLALWCDMTRDWLEGQELPASGAAS
ncbi:MAG TPA: Fe-S cluster assembly protein HesB [Blastocatellia bacterium]|jgi:N-glycosylase/DNA lyase|nr:Fe-S cluster assembly protein HesB [Blastocatellia bacterium]HAF23790.1 Fe-S cluster assembly protein HesB [Blastocatellia bacterium]